MNVRIIGSAVVCLVALAAAPPALAQRLNLTVSPQSISFASANPDTTPVIAAAPIVVTVRVRQNGGGRPWSLTVLANGNLISGPSWVDISNVTWTATPAPPFQGGTLNRTVAQRVASGNGNLNPAKNGSVTFRLANSWTYNAANYTQTLVFTLTAP